jgi:phage-related minor tail protein
MPSQSEILGQERAQRKREAAERVARAAAARRQALDDPKRREAITAYRIERERAEKQGKRVLRAIDDYRRTVPEFVYEAPTMFRLLPGRR